MSSRHRSHLDTHYSQGFLIHRYVCIIVIQCDRTTSLNEFLDHVLERCNGSTGGPTILGVIGCGCTEADLPVAELVHRWNMPQVEIG